MNRRKFINSMIRGSLVAGLGAISTLFIIRNSKNGNKACDFDFVCKNCRKINNCQLPQAALFKHQQQLKQ